ncbi:Putative Aldose 1-epimerase [Rhizopus microsporus]|nr:Putative Aldose 1-epimerase [Rhizopus microsporus]
MPVTKITIAPDVDQYTLINKSKTLAVMIMTYGATITHILTPDKTGTIRDVVLGFDDFESYKNPLNRYFGALVGRYANRIAQGKFTVDGKEYQLDINNGPNALHGGLQGFDKKIWTATVVSEEPASVRFELVSPDGDQGYPGTLTTQVTYTVTDKDELGQNAGLPIGARLEHLQNTRGYDHPYVIHNEYRIDTANLPLRHAVNVYSPESGIELDFYTTEPAFQFYTGGWLSDEGLEAKKDQKKTKLGPSSGFCLEASRNPDSPSKPDWRSAVLLQKDATYTAKTVYAFHARLD